MSRNSPYACTEYSFNGFSHGHGLAARDLFSRASELPESNFEARTLAQKLETEEPGR